MDRKRRKASAQGEKSKNDMRWLLKNRGCIFLCIGLSSAWPPSHSFKHHIKWMGTRKLQMPVVESKREQTFLALWKQKSESLQVRANIFNSTLVPTRKGSHGLSPWSAKLLFCWRVAFALAMPVTYTAGGKGSEGGMQFWFWFSAWSWSLL